MGRQGSWTPELLACKAEASLSLSTCCHSARYLFSVHNCATTCRGSISNNPLYPRSLDPKEVCQLLGVLEGSQMAAVLNLGVSSQSPSWQEEGMASQGPAAIPYPCVLLCFSVGIRVAVLLALEPSCTQCSPM